VAIIRKYTTLGIRKREVTGTRFSNFPDDKRLLFGATLTDTQLTTRITLTAGKPEGYTFGRPSKYNPAMCGLVVECGKKGYSKTQMCCELRITRSTLYAWEKLHTDFSDALGMAMTYSQAWWESRALWGITQPSKAFNAGLWGKIMSARFPASYRETSRTRVSGIEGTPIPVTVATTQITGENLADWYKQMMDGTQHAR
jgi:hypothetical protein